MDSEILNEEVKVHMLSATALRLSKSLLYVGETMLNKILVISGYFMYFRTGLEGNWKRICISPVCCWRSPCPHSCLVWIHLPFGRRSQAKLRTARKSCPGKRPLAPGKNTLDGGSQGNGSIMLPQACVKTHMYKTHTDGYGLSPGLRNKSRPSPAEKLRAVRPRFFFFF